MKQFAIILRNPHQNLANVPATSVLQWDTDVIQIARGRRFESCSAELLVV